MQGNKTGGGEGINYIFLKNKGVQIGVNTEQDFKINIQKGDKITFKLLC